MFHSHLLPGVDDGCKTLEESLSCARLLVENGYTHSFCTPHIWTNLPGNTVAGIPKMVSALQKEFDSRNIALKLVPGGENNIQPGLFRTKPDEVVTVGMNRKYVLIDLWAERLPDFFYVNVKWLQSLGLIVSSHPERMPPCRTIRRSLKRLRSSACSCREILDVYDAPHHGHAPNRGIAA